MRQTSYSFGGFPRPRVRQSYTRTEYPQKRFRSLPIDHNLKEQFNRSAVNLFKKIDKMNPFAVIGPCKDFESDLEGVVQIHKSSASQAELVEARQPKLSKTQPAFYYSKEVKPQFHERCSGIIRYSKLNKKRRKTKKQDKLIHKYSQQDEQETQIASQMIESIQEDNYKFQSILTKVRGIVQREKQVQQTKFSRRKLDESPEIPQKGSVLKPRIVNRVVTSYKQVLDEDLQNTRISISRYSRRRTRIKQLDSTESMLAKSEAKEGKLFLSRTELLRKCLGNVNVKKIKARTSIPVK